MPTLLSRPDLLELLQAAAWAPSGDNTQPWRFTASAAAGWIRVAPNPERDRSVMNPGQFMARLACGAAIENILVAARQRGWGTALEGAVAGALTVRLSGSASTPPPARPLWRERVTNRRGYDGRPLPAGVLAALRMASPPQDGTATHWISDSRRIEALAELMGRADALLLGAASVRRALHANLRFEGGGAGEVAEGMPLAALELPAAKRLGMRWLNRIPGPVLRLCGAGRAFASHTRALARSASALCLIVARDETALGDLHAGRALQRAWLAMTEQGLAVQPMMALPYFRAVLGYGMAKEDCPWPQDRLSALLRQLATLAPEIGVGRPVALLRLGYAAAPRARTGRLPVDYEPLDSPEGEIFERRVGAPDLPSRLFRARAKFPAHPTRSRKGRGETKAGIWPARSIRQPRDRQFPGAGLEPAVLPPQPGPTDEGGS